jgi:hypothetical protein
MKPYRTYARPQPDTYLYINDYLDDSDRLTLRRRETRVPTAILALAFGLGLATLMLLGTWFSLSPQATARVTTFVAHPEEPTLSTDVLEDRDLAPPYLDDILTRF